MPNTLQSTLTAIAALLLGLPATEAAAQVTTQSPAPKAAPASVASPARPAPCGPFTFEAADYTVCTVDPKRDDLRLFWQDGSGRPYRSFSRLNDAIEARGERLAFAINAAMYSETYAPVGLHVEDQRELSPAETRTIAGPPAKIPNFYKKPNGVFFVDPSGAGILETQAFLDRKTPPPRLATQSGPLLVIDGKLHPAFIPGSSDRTWRSGVGVCEGGAVRFAVSDDGVNFHDFARLFRDGLKCRDALFLDGGRGVGLHDAATGRSDWSGHGGYGPILGLVENPAADGSSPPD